MRTDDNAAEAQLDAALEVIARPEPPADHVARVLARTARGDASPRRPSPLVPRPSPLVPRRAPLSRWVVPLAATVLVAAAATWQVARTAVVWPDIVPAEGSASGITEADASARRPYQREAWGTPRELIKPVLPPQAYWGMDAFEEWRTLGREAPTGNGQPGDGNRQSADGKRRPATGNGRAPGAGNARVVAAFDNAAVAHDATPAGTYRSHAADDELVWTPVASGLPEIALSSIAPAPLEVVPLDEPPPITLQDITLEPIELAPFDEQEKP